MQRIGFVLPAVKHELIPNPTSPIPHPTSAIPHSTSYIPHPPSHIPHPPSPIPNPYSLLPTPYSLLTIHSSLFTIHFPSPPPAQPVPLSPCAFSCHGICRKKQIHRGAPGKKHTSPPVRVLYIIGSYSHYVYENFELSDDKLKRAYKPLMY